MIQIFAHLPGQQKVAVEERSQARRGESTNKRIEFGDPGPLSQSIQCTPHSQRSRGSPS
jgi:hypothetical protein